MRYGREYDPHADKFSEAIEWKPSFFIPSMARPLLLKLRSGPVVVGYAVNFEHWHSNTHTFFANGMPWPRSDVEFWACFPDGRKPEPAPDGGSATGGGT